MELEESGSYQVVTGTGESGRIAKARITKTSHPHH